MKLKHSIQSRRIAQVCTALALAGLVAYGAAGRASKRTSAGPQPVDTGWKAGGDVKVRANLSQTKVIQGSDGLVYLQVDLEAPEGEQTRQRRPTDFVIVLDRSGSMADYRKMEYAKKSIRSLINQLKDGDRFALVDFDSVVTTAIPLTDVTDSAKNRFRAKLDAIQPRDGTNLGGGLIAGIETLKSSGRKNGQAQKMILLSDGLANEGITDANQLNHIAERAVSGEFAISTIGVGLDFNENLMASLADYGRGNYTFLEELSALDKVLAQEFYGASKVYATGVEIRLDLSPGIETIEASGYPVERNGAATVVRPGHLYAGQKKTLFVTLRLPTDSLYARPLGSASVAFDVRGRHYAVSLLDHGVKVACLPPERKEEAVASIDRGVYKEAWIQNNYGRLLKDNAAQVKSGDRAGALGSIGAYRAKLKQAYEAAPAPEMKAQLDDLDSLEEEVGEAFSGPDAATKTKRLSKGYYSRGIKQQRTSN